MRAPSNLRADAPSPAVRTVLATHPGVGLYAADRAFLESVLGLRDAECRVVVVLPRTGPLVTELERAGAEVELIEMPMRGGRSPHPRGSPGTVLRPLLGLLRSWRLIGRVRPDVAYISTAAAPLWPLLARCRGVRSVSHLHELAGSGSLWLDRLLHLPHLASQQTLVSSRYSLETVRRLLPWLARRTDVLYSGIASPSHPAPPREPLEPPLRILYVGRLARHKGPDLGLEAVTLLQREGRPVEYMMVGAAEDGDEAFEQELRAHAAASGVDVEFAGFHRDIWPYVASADILVAPSRLEAPSGNLAVEAALALRPIVTSDPRATRGAGGGSRALRLVPPGDARALADALEDIADSWSGVVRALASGREEALRRHDPESYRARIRRACGVEAGQRSEPPRS